MEHEEFAAVHNLPELWEGPAFGDVAAIPLAAILQIAIEAAVLPNKFEIDEQTPHSRLEALMELAQAEVKRYPANAEQILKLVAAVVERVSVSIRMISPDGLEERRNGTVAETPHAMTS